MGCVRLGELKGENVALVVGVDRDIHDTCTSRTEPGFDEGQRVVRHDGDLGTSSGPKLHQTVCNSVCRQVDFAECPSGIGKLEERAGRVPIRGRAQQTAKHEVLWMLRLHVPIHLPDCQTTRLVTRRSFSSQKADNCSIIQSGRSSGIQWPHPSAMPPHTSAARRPQLDCAHSATAPMWSPMAEHRHLQLAEAIIQKPA